MSENSPAVNPQPEKTLLVGRLQVEIYPDRAALGRAAAAHAAATLRQGLARQGRAQAIFAAAPSQNELLANLCQADAIDWQNVTAFHLDEYLGLAGDAPQSFQTYLREHLF